MTMRAGANVIKLLLDVSSKQTFEKVLKAGSFLTLASA